MYKLTWCPGFPDSSDYEGFQAGAKQCWPQVYRSHGEDDDDIEDIIDEGDSDDHQKICTIQLKEPVTPPPPAVPAHRLP